MTVEQVQRILVDLLMRLPPELRVLAGDVAGRAAGTIHLWTPLAVGAWALVIVAVAAFVTEFGREG